MAGTSRRVDFLHLHANVSRRVRNLETGVHPTLAEGGGDVIPPTAFPINDPPWARYMAGTAGALQPKWQRRYGVVTLIGGVQPTPNWAAVTDEEIIGTLPSGARPLTDMIFNGAVIIPPYFAQFQVGADGNITVFKPPGISPTSSGGNQGVRFEGANWTID